MLNKPSDSGHSTSPLLWWPPSPCALPHCCLRNSTTEKELWHFPHDFPPETAREKYLSHIEQRKTPPALSVITGQRGQRLFVPRHGKAGGETQQCLLMRQDQHTSPSYRVQTSSDIQILIKKRQGDTQKNNNNVSRIVSQLSLLIRSVKNRKKKEN